MRRFWPLLFSALLVAGAGGSADHYQLALHWAPIIHQGAASNQDFLTRVDYDGDWIGSNNWENLDRGDLSAYVYYSLVETETHFFLFYSLFHPRDYEPFCLPFLCHENDLKSVQLAVAKDGGRFGRLQAMETLAHSHLYLYLAGPAIKGGYLRPRGEVLLEAGRPVIYVETYGHGIHGESIPFKQSEIVYLPGEAAERPASLTAKGVHYRLIPIYDTLWKRRDQVGEGKLFDRLFNYRGVPLPSAFDGDNYGEDRANTPWGYAQDVGAVLSRGDWFLNPAKAFAYHASFPPPYSLVYLFNPYLADLGLGPEPGG